MIRLKARRRLNRIKRSRISRTYKRLRLIEEEMDKWRSIYG